MTTNAEHLLEELDGSLIRFMTCLIIWDAPKSVYDRWADALFTEREYVITQSTWRIAMGVERQLAGES